MWHQSSAIAIAFALGGCGDKKQTSQDTSANTQQTETQAPSSTTDPAPPPVEKDKPVETKKPTAEPTKPRPAPEKPAPAKPRIENRDVTVPAGTELAVALREKLTTDGMKAGHPFTAVTKAPVVVDGLQPIPTGSIVSGEIQTSESAGRVGGKAKLTLGFRKIDLPDGKSFAIAAPPLVLEGEGTAKGDVEKVVGGAVGGAIIGGILGGKSGAGKGAAAGTVAGGALAVGTRGNDIVLEVGRELRVTLDAPITVPMIIEVAPGVNP